MIGDRRIDNDLIFTAIKASIINYACLDSENVDGSSIFIKFAVLYYCNTLIADKIPNTRDI